jgi:polyhydroxyalkanoate synthesis regulator phasin
MRDSDHIEMRHRLDELELRVDELERRDPDTRDGGADVRHFEAGAAAERARIADLLSDTREWLNTGGGEMVRHWHPGKLDALLATLEARADELDAKVDELEERERKLLAAREGK